MMDWFSFGRPMAAAAALLTAAQALASEAASCTHAESAAALERASANVALEMVAEGDGHVLIARNLRPAPSELFIEPRSGSPEGMRVLVLPPMAELPVLRSAAPDAAAARAELGAAWRIRSVMGSPETAAPDTDHLYRLPFAEGRTYRLAQGFGGKQSHQSEASHYALDFQLEEGEAVHAARGGTVVRAVDWFCRSGGRELVDQVNMVIVLHDDGTMAHYVHLAHKGVFVREGERVERGQHIGTVGMTGFTRGPHLHFVVRRERDVAIPVRFEGYEDADLSRKGRFRIR